MKKQNLAIVAVVIRAGWACFTAFSVYNAYLEDKRRVEQKELDKMLEGVSDEYVSKRKSKIDSNTGSSISDPGSISSSGAVGSVRNISKPVVETYSQHMEKLMEYQKEHQYDDETYEEDDETEYDDAEDNDSDDKDVTVLRFPPESKDAWNQWRAYRLMAVTMDNATYKSVYRLYDMPYVPTTDDDETVMQNLIEERMNFFGQDEEISKKATMAELLIWFAEKLDYDWGGGVEHWLTSMLKHLGLDYRRDWNDFTTTMNSISHHEFISPVDGMPGMFGYGMLSGEQSTSLLQDYWDYSTYLTNQMP